MIVDCWLVSSLTVGSRDKHCGQDPINIITKQKQNKIQHKTNITHQIKQLLEMPKRNKTPKSKNKRSSRIKKRSLRGMESDEYLLACGEVEGISDGSKDSINEDALAISGNKGALDDDNILDESIVVSENAGASVDDDVVASAEDNMINRGGIFKTDSLTLLSLPKGVVEFDSRYVKDIRFAIDGGEKMQ